MHQRRKQQFVLAILVVLAVLAVATFYLVVYRPVRSRYASLDRTVNELRLEIVQRKQMLENLIEAERRLAEADEGRELFLSSNLVPRDMGYAALLPDLDAMARRSGITRGRDQYQIEEFPQSGIYPVYALMPVSGDYTSIRRFIQELETSERFFLIDSLTMMRPEAENSVLAASLVISTFFADNE